MGVIFRILRSSAITYSYYIPRIMINMDNASKISLVESILQLKNTGETPLNLLTDLEIFDNIRPNGEIKEAEVGIKEEEVDITEADTTIFSKINKTKTIFGKIYLQHLICNPLDDVDKLNERQLIIRNIINSNHLASIEKSLDIIRGNEDILLWLWQEHSPEVEDYYNKNYFNSKYLDPLNNSSKILQIYNFYRIIISPITIIIYPALIFLSTYLFIKFIYKIKIPFQLFSKIFLKSKITDLLFFKLKKNNGSIFRYMITAFSILTYLYSVYICIDTSLTLHNTITNINHKTNALIELLEEMFKLNNNTFSLLKKKSTVSNPFDLFKCVKEMTLYTDRGSILTNFRFIRSERDTLTDIISYIAELDAYYSIAKLYNSTRKTHNVTCFPTYTNGFGTDLSVGIKTVDLWNPAINPNKAVPNTIDIMKNIIITGPNMGGKSTFIKSLMISVLFAQTLTISFSKSLEITPISFLQTYLNIPDCKGRESLFEAEMNRAYNYIKKLKNLDGNKKFSLIIIDEIFSSTNPREGLAGAYAIANKLSQYKNNISILTTHYTELALLEKTRKFKNYKIPIIRKNEMITYPYKLQRGVSQQYIAIELLKNKGFDDDIIKVANEICKKQETFS